MSRPKCAAMATHFEPDPFPYTPLDSAQRQIRLITLLPGPSNSPIQCTIALATIDVRDEGTLDPEPKPSKPTWEALSYTWGSLLDKVPILLNGRSFKVTKTLYSALIRLRYLDTARILWVDAICIDQSNLEERSVQVQQMPYIYQCADKVVIWLGEADDFEIVALAILDDLIEPHGHFQPMVAVHFCISAVVFWFWSVKLSVVCFLLLRLLSLVGWSARRFRRLEELVASPLSDQRFGVRYRATITSLRQRQSKRREDLAGTIEGMGQDQFFLLIWRKFALLLDRPWFSRMWIVQEASNAKEVIVLVGSYAIDWDRFCLIQMWVQARHHALSIGPDLHISMLGLELVSFFRRLKTSSIEGLDILPCLHICRGFQATDARDKIYALMGLLSANEKTVALKAGVLIPNYELPIRNVYMNLTRWHIDHSKSLDILNFILKDDEKNEHELPSWVPDWSIQKHTFPLHSPTFYQVRYKATLGTPVQTLDCPEVDCLALSGRFLDEVEAVVDEFHDLDSIGLPNGIVWSEWNRFDLERQHSRFSFSQERESLEAYWLTLVSAADAAIDAATCWQFFCSFFSRDDELPREFQDPRLAQEFKERCPQGEIPLSVLSSHAKDDFVHTKYSKVRTASAVDKIAEGLLRTLQGRKLFATREGRLGVGPMTTCVGDKIVLLMGGCLPFLVQKIDPSPSISRRGGRKKPEYHKFIGECYVHGLQNGEGMATAGEEGSKVEKIILK